MPKNNSKYCFTFAFPIPKKLYFASKTYLENIMKSLYHYIFITNFCVGGYFKCSNEMQTPI